MRSRLISGCSLFVLVTATSFGGGLAFGQAQPSTGESTSSDKPEEIVVTAQRRTEKLYDVPATVTVVSGAKIDKEEIRDLKDVVEHSPNVSYQQTGDTRADTLTIRGLTSLSNVSGIEPDAAIVIDGESLARTFEMNYNTVDIQRVEILEGPQGTLFGKNAVAGILNVTTKGPQFGTYFGDLKLGIAEDNEIRLKGDVNLPVNDHSAMYVNAYYNYSGGWVKNVNPSEPNGGQSSGEGGRIQYRWDPTDSLSILLRAEVSHLKFGPIPLAFKELSEADVQTAAKANCGYGAPGACTPAQIQSFANQFNALLSDSSINLVSPSGVSTPIVNGTLSYLSDDRNWGNQSNYGTSIQINKDFEAFTLIYQGSYRYVGLYSNDNEFGISAPQLTNSPYGLDALDYAGPTNETTVEQELRVESRGDGKLKYVAGAFYYFNDNFHHETAKWCNDAFYGNYYGGGFPNPNPTNKVSNFTCTGGYDGSYLVQDFSAKIDTHNEAFFGNVDYNVWGGLTAFAGARSLWEQQNMTMTHLDDDNLVGTGNGWGKPGSPTRTVSASTDEHALLHRVGAKYDFGNIMVYATESNGFKGTAWNTWGNVPRFDVSQPLKPETPQQVEVGWRGSLFNNRLDWNNDLYRIHDKNYQARVGGVFLPGQPLPATQIVNAGSTKNEGIQFSVNARLFKGFKVGGGWNWMTSEILSGTLIPTKQGIMNLKGDPLPSAPGYAYSLYADYGYDFADLDHDIRLEWRHRGLQEDRLPTTAGYQQPAYQILDAYYSIDSADKKWGVTLYCKNALNRLYYEYTYNPAALDWSAGWLGTLPRDYTRYFGANIHYHFN